MQLYYIPIKMESKYVAASTFLSSQLDDSRHPRASCQMHEADALIRTYLTRWAHRRSGHCEAARADVRSRLEDQAAWVATQHAP